MNTSWPLIMVHEHAGWRSICLCVIVYGCVFQSMCVIPVICIYIYIYGSCVPHFKVILHPLRCGQISSSLLIIMIFYPQICTCDRAMWSCCEHVTSLFVLFSKLSAFLEYIVTLLLLTFVLLFTFFCVNLSRQKHVYAHKPARKVWKWKPHYRSLGGDLLETWREYSVLFPLGCLVFGSPSLPFH